MTKPDHNSNSPREDRSIPSELQGIRPERFVAGQLALESIHEIKNPLEAIGNLSYLAAQEASHPESVRSYMRQIQEQVTHLNRIANQTLGVSRKSDTVSQADLVSLIEAAVRMHRQTIEAKKIQLVKKMPVDLMAQVHAGEMLQVISNSIINALHALPESGFLHLRLRRCHGKVHIVISDNGHGIPPEHVRSIFEPFFTTKGDEGTGLGLAISRKIVERHQGKIRMRSSVRSGRNGTTFRISLPDVTYGAQDISKEK